MPDSQILQFIGGLAFLFYGLHLIHQGLHFFAGDRFKSMLAKSTSGPIRSVLTGIVVTFFFQSSSAVTVMTVGLTASGMITLAQAMAVSLGAGVGTTFVVFLISLKAFLNSGLLIFLSGLCLKFFSKRKIAHIWGEIILGFGLVFFGLSLMSQATAPLKTYPVVGEIFAFMADYPLGNFLIAAVITGMVHSSAVVLAILISLAHSGSITLPIAIPLILGANIGTSFTAVMAAYVSKIEGKRVAWANLLLRLGGVGLMAVFLTPLSDFFEWMSRLFIVDLFHNDYDLSTQISLFHLFYNVFVAVVFLPLLPAGKKLVCWLIPESPDEKEDFGPKYLDKNALSTPTLAFAQANREVMRMAEIVQTMYRDGLKIFERYDLDFISNIEERDHRVDDLYKAVKFYLAQMTTSTLTEAESEQLVRLITAVNELEGIGDIIDRQMLRLAHKKWSKNVNFSPEGWSEICEMHSLSMEMMDVCLAAFSASNLELARKLQHLEINYTTREDKLKFSHMHRLHEARADSLATSSIHLELMNLFHQINRCLLTMDAHLFPDFKKNGIPFS